MAALPADIAKFTQDGVVIDADNAALKAAHPEAEDRRSSEIEMFFDDPADGQLMLDEKFALLSKVHPLHEGVEVAERLGLGIDIPLVPSVPCFTARDEHTGVEVVARTRAFAYESGEDRFSVEIIE